MQFDESTVSCGVWEMSGLPFSLTTVIRELKAQFAFFEVDSDGNYTWINIDYQEQPPFLIFSDIIKQNGDELAKQIVKNKLGTVQVTATRTNPRTGNPIKVWVWAPNWRAVYAYARKPC